MKERCNSLKHPFYADYGGRGITVCERWQNSFEAFLSDMGFKPSPKLTLERIDNNQGYFPGNCKWAKVEEQVNNRRSSLLVTVNGETLSISQWSRRTGISAPTLYSRKATGWPDAEMLSPVIVRPRKEKPTTTHKVQRSRPEPQYDKRLKMTAQIVMEIRRRRKEEGASYYGMAAEFGFSKATIRYAAMGTTWAHLPL